MKLRPSQMSTKAITRCLALAGAITGLALPGRRAPSRKLPVGAVPAFETEA